MEDKQMEILREFQTVGVMHTGGPNRAERRRLASHLVKLKKAQFAVDQRQLELTKKIETMRAERDEAIAKQSA